MKALLRVRSSRRIPGDSWSRASLNLSREFRRVESGVEALYDPNVKRLLEGLKEAEEEGRRQVRASIEPQ